MSNGTQTKSGRKQNRLATLRENYTNAFDFYVDSPRGGSPKRNAREAMNDSEDAWNDGLAAALGANNSQLQQLDADLKAANAKNKQLASKNAAFLDRLK